MTTIGFGMDGYMQNTHHSGMVFVKGDNRLCPAEDSIISCSDQKKE